MFFRSPYADALIVVLVLLLFFGPKRLPALGKSLGQGMREFKDSISGRSKHSDDEDHPELETATPPPATSIPQQPPQAAQPAPAQPQPQQPQPAPSAPQPPQQTGVPQQVMPEPGAQPTQPVPSAPQPPPAAAAPVQPATVSAPADPSSDRGSDSPA